MEIYLTVLQDGNPVLGTIDLQSALEAVKTKVFEAYKIPIGLNYNKKDGFHTVPRNDPNNIMIGKPTPYYGLNAEQQKIVMHFSLSRGYVYQTGEKLKK